MNDKRGEMMDGASYNQGFMQPSRYTVCDDEISLIDLYRTIKKHIRLIAKIVIVSSVVAVIVSFLIPKTYLAKATIMPLSGSGSTTLSALSSQLGGLASLAGVNIAASSQESKIMAILKSRTLAEKVILRNDLMRVFFKNKWDAKVGKWKSDEPPLMEDAVKAFGDAVRFVSDKKTNTISIHGEFRDPDLAARVVNSCIEELQNIINSKSFTLSKRNRIFLENQLVENKKEYLEAGKAISDFYRKNRISSVESSLDVKLGVKDLSFADNGLDDIDKKLKELMAKKDEINKEIAVAEVKNVPQQVYLSYLLLRRELLTKISGLLATQYEMAKIEEAKEDLAFQVIDDAVVPAYRNKPKRKQIVLLTFVTSLFIAVFIAFFLEYVERLKQQDKNQVA